MAVKNSQIIDMDLRESLQMLDMCWNIFTTPCPWCEVGWNVRLYAAKSGRIYSRCYRCNHRRHEVQPGHYGVNQCRRRQIRRASDWQRASANKVIGVKIRRLASRSNKPHKAADFIKLNVTGTVAINQWSNRNGW